MPHLFYLISTVIIVVALLALFILIFSRKKYDSKQHYPESEQLYIGNLSYQVNSFHLKQFFAQYGDLQDVRLIKNMRTGRSKGFAFITYSNIKDAKKALGANGADIYGRSIVVRMAKPRDNSV